MILHGLSVFYQEEDFKWCFSKYSGFLVPVFDENGLIQGLSIHLDKPFNNTENLQFSSGGKINGTAVKNYNRIYRDLLPIGYELDVKLISSYNEIFK